AALGALRHAKHRLEMNRGQVAGRGAARLELCIARQRERELAAHVLDLGKQAQGVEVVCALLEDRRDFRLGLGQLAELDENAGFLQALIVLHGGFNHRSSESRAVAGPDRGSKEIVRLSRGSRLIPRGHTPRYRALIVSLPSSSAGRDSWTIVPLLMR